ncbi:hypothetical protein Plec18170_002254 [Paecilomyces lecythidis]
MIWNSNVRIGRDGRAVTVSAAVANRLTPYILCHDYSNSQTARLFSEIYDFQFDEKVIDDYRNLQAERTDQKADVSGMYYGPDEVPVGLLKKALALENEGFNIEFCTDYFRAQYGVIISPNGLREAVEETRTIIAEQGKQFDDEMKQYNGSGIDQFEDTQRRVIKRYAGEVAVSEASALRQSGGQFSEQGYPTSVDDVIQKRRQDLGETTRIIGAGREGTGPSPDNIDAPTSSSKLSDKLHGIRMKLAKLVRLVKGER